MGRGVAYVPLTVGTAGAVAKNSTEYSVSNIFKRTTGEAAVYIVSTAGSITVTQQCSLNGSDFYDPIDDAGNNIGTVCTGLTVTTGKYIQYSPVLAPHVRFKVVEGNVAATTVTLTLIFQEDN